MRIIVAPSMVSCLGKFRHREVMRVTSWPAAVKCLMAYFVTVDPPPPIGGNSLLMKRRFMLYLDLVERCQILWYSLPSKASSVHNMYEQQYQPVLRQVKTEIRATQEVRQEEE